MARALTDWEVVLSSVAHQRAEGRSEAEIGAALADRFGYLSEAERRMALAQASIPGSVSPGEIEADLTRRLEEVFRGRLGSPVEVVIDLRVAVDLASGGSGMRNVRIGLPPTATAGDLLDEIAAALDALIGQSDVREVIPGYTVIQVL